GGAPNPDTTLHGGATWASPPHPPCLPPRNWCTRGAGAALDFQRLHDEGELVDALTRQLVELEILEQMNAVHDQRDLMHRQRNLWVRVGRHLDRPVVGAEQHRVLRTQPLGGRRSDALTRPDI